MLSYFLNSNFLLHWVVSRFLTSRSLNLFSHLVSSFFWALYLIHSSSHLLSSSAPKFLWNFLKTVFYCSSLFEKVFLLFIDFCPELIELSFWVFSYFIECFQNCTLKSSVCCHLNHSLPCLWVYFLCIFSSFKLPCYPGYSWYLIDYFSAWAFEGLKSVWSTCYF